MPGESGVAQFGMPESPNPYGTSSVSDFGMPKVPRQYSPKGWGSNPNQLFETGGGISKNVYETSDYLKNLLGL